MHILHDWTNNRRKKKDTRFTLSVVGGYLEGESNLLHVYRFMALSFCFTLTDTFVVTSTTSCRFFHGVQTGIHNFEGEK